MIHYNVWFSFKEGTVETEALAKATFHAPIVIDAARFAEPFEAVAASGVHTGLHGLMIENVETFIVEVFEEVAL